MNIKWFQKISLIEYPDKIAMVLFSAGCNFRCPFCYVPQLVIPEKYMTIEPVSSEKIFSYLERVKKMIDAVVITGGEPTVNEDLPDMLRKIKSFGYLTGIYTNGTNDMMIREIIDEGIIDYIAMDIKTRLDMVSYSKVTGTNIDNKTLESIKKSIKIIMGSNINYEFRTTLVKELHSMEDIWEICQYIKGARIYYLQNLFNATYLGAGKLSPYPLNELQALISRCKNIVNAKYRNQNRSKY
ncbi:MAG: anaerobic ribonucleoside-triphosphate reductase activating protein [Thermoplasmata archaeon]